MFKNQLQELAQRSCFNLPSYSCIREGPDHAPRFKATVNFNGETFESPSFCSTLRQAEHTAAEVALGTLAERGPSKTLAARVLDETGVYKNLLQETAHRAGLNLPVYTTFRTGQGQVPTFSCTVELAGMSFLGKPARTKKLAQKNAAMAAWSSLRTMSQQDSSSSPSSPESRGGEEREQVIIARALTRLQPSNSKESIENNQSLGLPKVTHSCLESKNLLHLNFPPLSLSPEINLSQLWQQNFMLQQQYCLLGLSLSPPIPPPRIHPFMQSWPHPFHPSFHFPTMQGSLPPVPSVPKLLVSSSDLTSSVTIQEIQEEKPEEPSRPKRQESSQKSDQRESIKVPSKTGHVQLQRSPAELHQWLPADESSNFRSKPIDFRLATSSRPSSSSNVARSDPLVIRNTPSASLVALRARNMTSMEALTRLKPGPFSYSPRFGYENYYDHGEMRSASMAPPVRVRSVVRVCSAPPLIKTPSFTKEGKSSNGEGKI